MKDELAQLLQAAVTALDLPEPPAGIRLERTRDEAHGDFASNLALTLAKPAGRNPRELAEALVGALPANDLIDKTEIAGPGFINVFLKQGVGAAIVNTVLEQGEAFGRGQTGAGQNIQIEFVSANPTGPLHVGHGRGAAYGASLANLLAAAGFKVQREYYVNDAGRQMHILATSVWLRYLEAGGADIRFPNAGYRGDYVLDIAAAIRAEQGERLQHPLPTDLPDDDADKEAHIDALIAHAQQALGEKDYRLVFDAAANTILADIREDLAGFGVTFDEWFSERGLFDNGAVADAVARLKASGDLEQRDDAWWFKTTAYGDEKDRVVVRANGEMTYFASDIAYHLNKQQRGFDRVIDIWGADHHGYIPRVRAALQASGVDDDHFLDVRLVQFAVLWRGGEKVPMSTRSGQFVTLRELRKEVGNDAARFFYVLRSADQHLDFDLDLAKSQSNDNPVYYVQYAHARVCSVLRQLAEQGLQHDAKLGAANLHRLTESHEQALIARLSAYPELIDTAARNGTPHSVAHFLRELAQEFHSYYNAHRLLMDDDALRNARLNLSLAVRQVTRNGLALLGVSTPETM